MTKAPTAIQGTMQPNATTATARAAAIAKPAMIALMLGMTTSLAACSTTTLPWPSLSISRDDADEALSKEEQSLLADLLAASEKNHRKEAIEEIESR